MVISTEIESLQRMGTCDKQLNQSLQNSTTSDFIFANTYLFNLFNKQLKLMQRMHNCTHKSSELVFIVWTMGHDNIHYL